MKHFKVCLLSLLAAATMSGFMGCSTDDEPEPQDKKNETISPTQPVDDPAGTITLLMRNANNGETSLEGAIYIDKGDNFVGDDASLCDLGRVAGLGNVTSIPTTGWAPRVAVTPGHGYVACDARGYSDYYNREAHYTPRYYRIYVVDYLEGVGGGIIGAQVKYEADFIGSSQAIELETSTVRFDSKGGRTIVRFKNSAIIPFKTEISKDSDYSGWYEVYSWSSSDRRYSCDGVRINVGPNNTGENREAVVTLKALNGTTAKLKIIQTATSEP